MIGVIALIAALGFAGWVFFKRKPVEDATVKAKELAEEAEEKAPEDIVEAAKEALVKPPLVTEVAPEEPVVIAEVIPKVPEPLPVDLPSSGEAIVRYYGGAIPLSKAGGPYPAKGESAAAYYARVEAWAGSTTAEPPSLAPVVVPIPVVIAPTPAPPAPVLKHHYRVTYLDGRQRTISWVPDPVARPNLWDFVNKAELSSWKYLGTY